MMYNPFIKPQFEEEGMTRIIKAVSLKDMAELGIITAEQLNNIDTSANSEMEYDDNM